MTTFDEPVLKDCAAEDPNIALLAPDVSAFPDNPPNI
jgi:hypothetical protein